MAAIEHRIRVGPEVVLAAPDGSDVRITHVQAALTYDGDRLEDVRITFRLDPETWARVDAGGWFHLDPDARGPTFGGALRAGEPVEIEARLSQPGLTAAAVTTDDEWDVGAQIRGGRSPEQRDGEPLPPGRLNPDIGLTEGWRALAVKQPDPEIPGLKTGFATIAGGWSPPSA